MKPVVFHHIRRPQRGGLQMVGSRRSVGMPGVFVRRRLFMAIAPFIATVFVIMGNSSCRQSENGNAVPSDPLFASAAISTNSIHIGDVVSLTLNIVHPNEGQLQVPDFARGKEIIIRDRKAREERISDTSTRTILDYQLTSLAIGNHTLSTGLISFAQADGQKLNTLFPFVTLEVASTLTGESTAPHDIKGLAHWPGRVPRWFIGLLAALLIAGVLAMILKHVLSKPRTILHMPPLPPAHEIALQALKNLLAKGWIEARNIEPFYVELSGIVRRYIEDRFNLKAPERTTEEFIREAANSRVLSSPHQLLTRDFLEQCDLVKFARHEPESGDMKNAAASAERLITETIPVVEPVKEEVPS
jgi:hypothetical protein